MKITKKAKVLINWQSISIKNRLLALFSFCLVISSLVSIGYNTYLGLPFEMNIVVIIVTSIHGFAFYQAIRNRINDRGRAIYLFSLMSLLPVAWIFNGGLDGSIPMHFFTYLIISIFTLAKKFRKITTIYCALLIIIVLVIQNHFNHIIVPYASQQIKLVDMEISFVQVIITIILLTIMYTNINESYQKKLLRQKKQLRLSFNQLSIAKEVAEEATIAKSNFITNISHEIRTPLNGIVGITDILDLSQLNTEQETLIQSLKSSSKTLSDLVNDLLDLSKIEANKISLNYEDYDLRKVAQEVNELIRLQIKDKDILLKIDIDPMLPSYLKIDRTKYKQVLINILSNASKFTEKGEINLKIYYNNSNKILTTIVKDTGIGITKNNLDDIFVPFTQLTIPKGIANNGVGMGLAISKKMIEFMKGEISVSSIPNQGSSFQFSLPIQLGKVNKKEEFPEIIQSNDFSYHILIAEDNKINQIVLSKMLENLNHTYDIANDGEEAVSMAISQNFDIILMDIQMPIMNGKEATNEIIKHYQLTQEKQPVIIGCSANILEYNNETYLKNNMSHFLIKPIDLNQLSSVLNKIEISN